MVELLHIEEKKYYKTIQVDGKQVRLHRYKMEQHLGRKLHKDEVVHHIDEDIYNNNLSNLKVVSRSEHIKIHPKIIQLSAVAKTKYDVDPVVLTELFKNQRLTLKVISETLNIPAVALFHCVKRFKIVREDIFCSCGAKLKFSKTMMCNKCRNKFNHNKKRCQK